MPGFEYTIRQGESLDDLARRYRVEGGWRAIWDDEHNDNLRRLRGGPERLCPGDRIFIPGADGNVCETPSGVAADFSEPPPWRIFAEDGRSAPPTVVPTRGSIRMKAVHDEGAQGTWTWSTPSRKITLAGQGTDTVTIRAGANVSGADGEIVRLSFAPADGGTSEGTDEECESAEESTSDSGCGPEADDAAQTPAGGLASVTTNILVISVIFSPSPSHPWGYDGMGPECDDATPAGQTPHLSVRQRSRGEASVSIRGGAGGGVIHFTSDDASIAVADSDGAQSDEFLLFIDGKGGDSAETIIRARANADDGPICASLAVNVYREKSCTAKVAKVWDRTSEGTRLSRPSFSVADTQTAVRGYYKQAVVTITLSDYSADGGVLNVNYDPNRTGKLILEAGRTSSGEQAIRNALSGTDKKIVVVKDLEWLFLLGKEAQIGDREIALASHVDATKFALITPDTYRFGGPGNYEDIRTTGTDATKNIVTLASGLTKNHPVTEGLWWPLGGLSGDPAFVREGSNTQEVINMVIGHEFGHEILNLRDLDKTECMMHFSNDRTGMKIRFKNQPRYYNPPGGNENQWNVIPRQ